MIKTYIGVKTIQGKPMYATEAYAIIGKECPEDLKGKYGYLVIYPDGYKSWSPKDVFEAAYVEVPEQDEVFKNALSSNEIVGYTEGTIVRALKKQEIDEADLLAYAANMLSRDPNKTVHLDRAIMALKYAVHEAKAHLRPSEKK